MRILLLIAICVVFAQSQRSFDFEFSNAKSRRVDFVKINNGFIYIFGAGQLDDNESYDNYLAKYDFNGIQIFNKEFSHLYRDVPSNIEIVGNDIYVMSDWDPSTSTLDDCILSKFDLNGNLIMTTGFGSNQDDMIADLLIVGDSLYMSGSDEKSNYFIKLNKNTLQKDWVRSYNGLPSYRSMGLSFKKNKFYTCGYNVYSGNDFLIQKINIDGYPEITKTIKLENRIMLIDGFLIGDDYYLVGKEYKNINNTILYFIKFDLDLHIIEKKQVIAKDGIFNNNVVVYNNNFYFTYSNQGKSILCKLDNSLITLVEKSIPKSYTLIDIQDEYFIYLFNSNVSKLIFDKNECYIQNDTTVNQIDDLLINIQQINNIGVSQGQDFKKFNYNISNGNLTMVKNICLAPCGTGSFFETKFASSEEFKLMNTAKTKDDSYVLTKEKSYFSYGAILHTDPVFISAGFNTEFAFKVDKGFNDFVDGSLPGADGFTLIFHSEPISSFKNEQLGGGMGYHNRKNTLAMEIDLYNNTEYNDPNGNHIALQKQNNGIIESIHSETNTIAIDTNIIELVSDGLKTYYCKMSYENQTLNIWLDNTKNYNNPVISIPNFDFNQYLSLIDNSKIYVTLAAVTGSSYQKQEVLYWDWCSEFDPVSSILQETETTEINIYPNPSSDILHINGILSNQTIEMYDITGRLLISQKYDKNIDVSNFNRGIYMVKVDNQFYKFIKN